jgi:chromosome segregation ATPase
VLQAKQEAGRFASDVASLQAAVATEAARNQALREQLEIAQERLSAVQARKDALDAMVASLREASEYAHSHSACCARHQLDACHLRSW